MKKKAETERSPADWIVLFVITANARPLEWRGRLGKSRIFNGTFIFHRIFVFAHDFPIAATLIVLISMRLSARRKCVMKTNFKMDQMHPEWLAFGAHGRRIISNSNELQSHKVKYY